MKKIERLSVAAGAKLRDRMRSTQRCLVHVGRASRSLRTDQGQERLRQCYGRLLTITGGAGVARRANFCGDGQHCAKADHDSVGAPFTRGCLVRGRRNRGFAHDRFGGPVPFCHLTLLGRSQLSLHVRSQGQRVANDERPERQALLFIVSKRICEIRMSSQHSCQSHRISGRFGDSHPAMGPGNESSVSEKRHTADDQSRAFEVEDGLEKQVCVFSTTSEN